jgi:hypothetical protein
MAILNREELQSLIGKHNDYCVSIYLPIDCTDPETRHDPIRLKDLLHEAEKRLFALGLWGTQVHELLKPAQQLLDQEHLWQRQSDGLALFLTEDFFRYYSLPVRFPKLAVVTDRFHLKPLLRYFTNDGQFYLLALSQNRVRVFQGSRDSLNEILFDEMPVSVADPPSKEEPQQTSLFHAGAPSGRIRSAGFHNQAGEDEIRKYSLRRFFRWINASLHNLLRGEHAPLVLAGAEYLHPIYRSVDTYPHRPIEGIHGNTEQIPLEEVHKQAWTIVQSYYKRARKDAEEVYWELTGTGKTTNRVSEAVVGAVHGRIATLFVQANSQHWGGFDAELNAVTPHPDAKTENEDLIDLMALRTLATGGTVFAVPQDQMPDISPVAAIFRH